MHGALETVERVPFMHVLDNGCHWIAVAVHPDGRRKSRTFGSKTDLNRFVDLTLNEWPDARIYYAIPSIVTRETRAR